MKSILVVDDEEIVLEEIRAHLGFYHAHLAKSGRTALEMARFLKPDLIILDIIMPGMNGFEVLDQLQQHPHLRQIPVILLTDDDTPAMQVKGLKSGAVDFLLKPVDREILHHRIKLHLNFAEYRRSLEHSVSELENNIGLSFAELIECKDYNFSGHVMRTGKYAEFLALSLYDEELFAGELSLSFIETLARAAPFHDIGKIGISEEILCKRGCLNSEELKTVHTHTVIGARILDDIYDRIPSRPYFKMAELIARGHHERFNGTGYPEGFAGEDIPLCCRIVSVVNVYDACVSERVYHPPMEHGKACEVIEQGRGTEFDPAVADVFLQHNDKFARLGEEMKTLSLQLGTSPALREICQ
ncbi:two-component system response regulator [Spirochaetia bacterium]|nr:two-component system response regulator [Spirochaetia bacterium]